MIAGQWSRPRGAGPAFFSPTRLYFEPWHGHSNHCDDSQNGTRRVCKRGGGEADRDGQAAVEERAAGNAEFLFVDRFVLDDRATPSPNEAVRLLGFFRTFAARRFELRRCREVLLGLARGR